MNRASCLFQLVALVTISSLGDAVNPFEDEENTSALLCPWGTERFSAKQSGSHFYQCMEGVAVLNECPDDEVYVTKKQKCMRAEDDNIEPLDEPALGRNFRLGSLYDARTEKFFPSSSLWKQDDIRNNSFTYNRRDVNTVLSSAKTVKQKSFSWGMHASIKIKILFFSIGGSAGYMQKTTDTDTEVNVAMTYSTTKYSETIPKKVPITFKQECDTNEYTHVVTSVTYGMKAVFNFNRQVHEHEFEGKVSGSLGWVLNMIPGLATGSHHKTDEDDYFVADEATLRMYGDFAPNEPLPATLDQAIDFYRNLPTMTGSAEDGWKGSTIMEAHLTPITDFCQDSSPTLREVADSLIESIGDMLDELEQLEMKVGGLLAKDPSLKYPPVKKNLQIYKKDLEYYTRERELEFKNVLPSIKAGEPDSGEEQLVNILQAYNSSQFKFEISSEFLSNRAREIQAIRFLLESFPEQSNLLVGDYESASDVELIFDREKVVIMQFNVLSPESLTQSFLANDPVDESNFWYNKIDINGQVGLALHNFFLFAMENVNQTDRGYLIKLGLLSDLSEELTKPIQTNAYIKGQLISREFEVPVPPTTPSAPFDEIPNGFSFSIPRGNKFVTGCKFFVHEVQSNNVMEDVLMFAPEGKDDEQVTVVVRNLQPLMLYSYYFQYITEVGISVMTGRAEPFLTPPCSLPQNLHAVKTSYQSIDLKWEEPAVSSQDVLERLLYRVILTPEVERDASSPVEVVTAMLGTTFTGLRAATSFSVVLTAFVPDFEVDSDLPTTSRDVKHNKTCLLDVTCLSLFPVNVTKLVLVETPPVIQMVFTSPFPPTMLAPQQEDVGLTSITVSWQPPLLSPGDSVAEYGVEYQAMDYNGTAEMTGLNGLVYLQQEQFTVEGLTSDSVYSFKTKVFTTAGDFSDFSMEMFVRTNPDIVEIEKTKDELMARLEDLSAEAGVRSIFCSFATNKPAGDRTITFDSVFLQDNNVGGAEMNKDSGLFTAGSTGTYQVFFGVKFTTDGGQDQRVYVKRNNNKVSHSQVHSTYNSLAQGEGHDQASKSITMQLAKGDQVCLYQENEGSESGGLNDITFCVSSVTVEQQ